MFSPTSKDESSQNEISQKDALSQTEIKTKSSISHTEISHQGGLSHSEINVPQAISHVEINKKKVTSQSEITVSQSEIDFSDSEEYVPSPITETVILTERKNGFRMGTDSVLLSKFVSSTPMEKGVDLGTGSGVIPLLLLSENKCKEMCGIEVQEGLYHLAKYNAKTNGMKDRFFPLHGDIREIKKLYPPESADFVTLNPPYFKRGTGKESITEEKLIARHEMNGVIGDFCASASYCLKFGGKFFAVFRADRLTELLYAMRDSKIEPKHIELIYKGNKVETVLVKGIKGAKEGLTIEVRPSEIVHSK